MQLVELLITTCKFYTFTFTHWLSLSSSRHIPDNIHTVHFSMLKTSLTLSYYLKCRSFALKSLKVTNFLFPSVSRHLYCPPFWNGAITRAPRAAAWTSKTLGKTFGPQVSTDDRICWPWRGKMGTGISLFWGGKMAFYHWDLGFYYRDSRAKKQLENGNLDKTIDSVRPKSFGKV